MQEDVLKLVNDQLNELPLSEKARKAADDLIEELAFVAMERGISEGALIDAFNRRFDVGEASEPTAIAA